MTSPAALGHDRDTAQVDYRVLGALAATCGDSRLELGGKRQRMVLAVLLANPNRVISQDALIDAVWNAQFRRAVHVASTPTAASTGPAEPTPSLM